MYFLGIDIGTSESKGALVDENMQLLASAARPHIMESPKPGYAEHDAEKTWWADFCAISRELLEKTGVSPTQIAAVGVSTIAPCCLPVDKDLKPLRKAILYGVDVRAGREIDELQEEYGEEYLLNHCGSPVSSQTPAAKLCWLKRHEPEMHKAYKFLTGSSYVVAKLTGVFAIDHYTAASWVPMYNIAGRDWEKEISRFCRRDQLADCYWTQQVVGKVHAEAARQTGLAEGTPVICGTADAAAEATSVGVLESGDMMLMYGSSLFMIHMVKNFVPDARYCASPYIFPGTSAVTAGMSTTGTLTRWFRDEFARDLLQGEENAYAVLAKEAEAVPAGAGGLLVLPYLSGERTPICDPAAQGVIFGLNLTHTRGHLYQACLEGVGYGVAQHFEAFSQRGMEPGRLVAVGGGTKNRRWLQAVSDICQRPQHLMQQGLGAAYGDAMLAALGVGRFTSPAQMQSVLKEKECIRPDADKAAMYRQGLSRYTRLYMATKDLMHEKLEG